MQKLTANGTIASVAGYCALVPPMNVESAMTTPRVYSALLSIMTKTIVARPLAFSSALPVVKIRHAIAPGSRISTQPVLQGGCVEFGLPVQIILVAIVSEK